MPVDQNTTHRVVPTTEARQGVTHHNVRTVLNVSLGLAIVALVAVYFILLR